MRRRREGRHKKKDKRQEGRALWGNVRYLSVSIAITLEEQRVALMSKSEVQGRHGDTGRGRTVV